MAGNAQQHRLVLAVWLCLLLVFYQTCTCQGTLQSVQRQADGKYGVSIPLEIRHGVHRTRGRSLLRSGMLPVLGAIREGYFYAKLGLGTPPKNYSTIIDTGSTITYIPCANCKHCGNHMTPAFDPSKSATAQMLTCQHQLCDCGSPGCTCVDKKCYYSRHYAEMSSSEGWLVLDKLQFPDRGSSIDFVFGCENKETGAIYAQKVDGVLGMGNNMNSFPRQLARSGLVDDVFSLCYGFPEGGRLLLGDVPLGSNVKLQYTPLIDRKLHYYNIDLHSISLNGKSLAVSMTDYTRGYGTVLDSGTTFTYLPSSAFKAFLAVLETALKGKGLRKTSGGDPEYNDICWRGAPADFQDIGKYFPTGSVNLADGVSFKLTPERYLFMVGRGEYCLGVFDNGYQGTLIGGIIVRNVLVQYDRRNSRVGFAEVDCNNLTSAPSQTASAAVQQAAAAASAAVPQAATSTSATGESQQDDYHEDEDTAEASKQQAMQQQADSTSSKSQPSKQQAAAGDEQYPGRQQQQQPTTSNDGGGSSSAADTGSSSSQSQQGGSNNHGELWLGFIAGGVVVAVVIQGVHMYVSRRRSNIAANSTKGSAAADAGYGRVTPDELDVATELTPLAGQRGMHATSTVV